MKILTKKAEKLSFDRYALIIKEYQDFLYYILRNERPDCPKIEMNFTRHLIAQKLASINSTLNGNKDYEIKISNLVK